MGYDIDFKVKVEGKDLYVPVGDCEANTTWNVRDMIKLSTGLPWENCKNNGFCKDVIPHIQRGLKELRDHPEKYKPYEAKNGWGTVESTIRFFEAILDAWTSLQLMSGYDVAEAATFWIE